MSCEGRISSVAVCKSSDSGETVIINPASIDVSTQTSLTSIFIEELKDVS